MGAAQDQAPIERPPDSDPPPGVNTSAGNRPPGSQDHAGPTAPPPHGTTPWPAPDAEKAPPKTPQDPADEPQDSLAGSAAKTDEGTADSRDADLVDRPPEPFLRHGADTQPVDAHSHPEGEASSPAASMGVRTSSQHAQRFAHALSAALWKRVPARLRACRRQHQRPSVPPRLPPRLDLAKHDAHGDGKPHVVRFNYDLAACANYELTLSELTRRYGEIYARLSKASALNRAPPLGPPDADAGHTSPPPSPPDTDDEDDEEERRTRKATPASQSPPSPPPSPPQPLSTRLSLLRAAEEAVTTTYAYPRFPESFAHDVRPHLLRYIQSEGKKVTNPGTHAVYAALILSDPRTEAASEAEVAHTLHAGLRTMRRWKMTIDALRAEAVDANTLLAMAVTPPASAPPSPAATDSSEVEGLSVAFASLPPSLGDTSPGPEERVTWRIQNDAGLAAPGAPKADPHGMRWDSTEAYADRDPKAAGSAMVIDATDPTARSARRDHPATQPRTPPPSSDTALRAALSPACTRRGEGGEKEGRAAHATPRRAQRGLATGAGAQRPTSPLPARRRILDYDEVFDYDELIELLDKDDEPDATEMAPAAQAAGPILPGHGGANTPPPAAPAAAPPRQDASLEPQLGTPQWRTVEASVEIEGTPQQRVACPVLYRPSKQSVATRAPRPRAPRRPRPPPTGAKPGPIRHERAYQRRQRLAALYHAAYGSMAQRLAPTFTTGAQGTGSSADPYMPRGKYEFGTEVIRYNWDGLAISAELAPDPDGHGTGLRYTGDQPMSRGQLVGVYMGDVLIPAHLIRTMAADDPLLGEHAVASLGWAIADLDGRSAISRVNESAHPNLELTEVDMNPRGDEPSYTLMAMYTIDTVHPGDWFTTDYGPDYEPVRAARGYARPYVHRIHGRSVQWLSTPELDRREQVLRAALSPAQLRVARRWGGVLDHEGRAGGRNDPNRPRGLPTPSTAQTPPAPSPPTSPPESETDEQEEIEEVEVEIEVEDGLGTTDPHRDGAAAEAGAAESPYPSPEQKTAPQAKRAKAAPQATLVSNTAVASPSASTPRSAGGTTGERAHVTLRWAGRGPAPRGLETIHLAAGTTRLVTSHTTNNEGDTWGGTFDVHVDPPSEAAQGLPRRYAVRVISRNGGPRYLEEPVLLVSWATPRPGNSHMITTIEIGEPNPGTNLIPDTGTSLCHGEIFGYGVPCAFWRDLTHVPIKLAVTRLDWAFLVVVHSEPALEPGPPGWPQRTPPSTPVSRPPNGGSRPPFSRFSNLGSHGPSDGEPDDEPPTPDEPTPPSPPTSPPESEGESEGSHDGHGAEDAAPPDAVAPPPAPPQPQTPQHPPPPSCKLDGCERPCFPREDGGWHDYCGRTHAQLAISQRRAHDPAAPRCARPGCEHNAWRRSDKEGGGFHRCCGRTCERLLAASEDAARQVEREAARAPPDGAEPIDTARGLTEEERQAGTQRLNTASSGPSPFVKRRRRAPPTFVYWTSTRDGAGTSGARRQAGGATTLEGDAHGTLSLGQQKRQTRRAGAASRLARRLAGIKMAIRRTCTDYAVDLDEATSCVTGVEINAMVKRLDELTGDGAYDAIEAAFAPLRAAYDDVAWEEMGAQRAWRLAEHEAARERAAGRRAACPICGAQCALSTAPRLLGGCNCGGGICAACGADTCACPWDGSFPSPPIPSTAALQRNHIAWGYVELPLGDPYAPTILIVGDTAGAMARACSLTFPAELCLTVSYRTRREDEHGLYWCGDACDVLWRQRWRLVIAHPDRMRTAPRDATRQARIASGELWWSMARTVMLYCAPAETVVIECPCPELALTWRAPDTTMRLADYGVNSPLSWCLWQRGGFIQAIAQTPHSTHAATRAAQTPPPRGAGDGGRAPRRHETPPEIANAICASIDLQSGAPREQPLYHEMVETLAESYRRHSGSEPPDGYAEPTAQPLHPSQRRAPRSPAGAGSAANLETHFLAGLPLRPGTHAAEERARRATPERRADAHTSGATEQHGGHGTHRAPPHGAT